jgi:hypothetical protein
VRKIFTASDKSDQANLRWRIGNGIHVFIVASVLSGLDVVRIAVKVQKILLGLHTAKENTGPRTWWVGEGEEARRTHGSGGYGGEIDPVYDQTRVSEESSPDHLEWSSCGVEGNDETHTARNEGPARNQRVWHGSNSDVSTGALDGPILMGRVGSRRLDCVASLSTDDIAVGGTADVRRWLPGRRGGSDS